jgi:hypothetical protein
MDCACKDYFYLIKKEKPSYSPARLGFLSKNKCPWNMASFVPFRSGEADLLDLFAECVGCWEH